MTLCLALGSGPCRDHLLPGYEAASRTACRAALDARPPDLAALDMAEVAGGVFVHLGSIAEPGPENRGDVANLGFVVGRDSVAVIGTGSARRMGEALWRSIRARTDKPVSHVILTHMHPDHALGATPLAEAGAQVPAHADLARALADRQANHIESLHRLIGIGQALGTAVAPVDTGVDTRVEMDLGGRVLDLRA